MRRIRSGKVNRRVMNVIGRNYNKLREMCGNDVGKLYCSESFEDIFHDTIQFVIQDKSAASLATEGEIIYHFVYRYRMIRFQRIMDDKMLREVEYADYKENKKTKED